LQFTYPQASIKNVQATGEALSLQKRTPSPSKQFLKFFLFLWVIFALINVDPDPDSESMGEGEKLFKAG
jgi:hypothetical protein